MSRAVWRQLGGGLAGSGFGFKNGGREERATTWVRWWCGIRDGWWNGHWEEDFGRGLEAVYLPRRCQTSAIPFSDRFECTSKVDIHLWKEACSHFGFGGCIRLYGVHLSQSLRDASADTGSCSALRIAKSICGCSDLCPGDWASNQTLRVQHKASLVRKFVQKSNSGNISFTCYIKTIKCLLMLAGDFIRILQIPMFPHHRSVRQILLGKSSYDWNRQTEAQHNLLFFIPLNIDDLFTLPLDEYTAARSMSF